MKKKVALSMLFLDFMKLSTEHDDIANFYLKDTVIIFSELKTCIS